MLEIRAVAKNENALRDILLYSRACGLTARTQRKYMPRLRVTSTEDGGGYSPTSGGGDGTFGKRYRNDFKRPSQS